MIFRQLFEPESSTYTYLLGCEESREAILLDPVLETVDRDLAALRELGLTLSLVLDTHVHADHVTGACTLRKRTGCRVAFPAAERLECADLGVEEGRPLSIGRLRLDPLFTPGHTDTHHSYLLPHPGGDRVFTGDALLIDGCGRTDFQNGSPEALYQTLTGKLFALAGETLVYPAHDYQHRHVSTIAQERERNPRAGGGKSLSEFVAIMNALALPYPKKMDLAVPANRRCGDCAHPPAVGLDPLDKSEQGVPTPSE